MASFDKSVKLSASYNIKTVIEDFMILKGSLADILLGKNLMERLRSPKKFPIKCKIPTRGNIIVSWSRSIKNQVDKKDFRPLIREMENRGFIEKSRSLCPIPSSLSA